MRDPNEIETSLRWFFSDTLGPAGELGCRSSFEGFENQCMSGAGGGMNAIGGASAAHDRAIAAMPAAGRYRAIADVLHRLSPFEQLLLKSAFSPSRRRLPVLEESTPIVVAYAGEGRVQAMLPGATKDPNRRTQLVALRVEAERALTRARASFWMLAGARAEAITARRRTTREARIAELRGRLEGVA